MPSSLKTYRPILFLLLILLCGFTSIAQNDLSEELLDSYEEYAAAPREVLYVHLNKSTYIEGEMMGFKAYVFDKFTKERSLMTTNLYCTISDNEG
ncbi:MAG: hypothetical protein AAF901_01800, partial [Bacteroidota bacterium]